jgi:Cu(I)/Ag(I) efflux system membrane protein CusA/SilA
VIKKIISFSAHNKFIVLSVTFVLCVLGYLSIKNIPVDAIPDLSDTQVIIYTRWDQSPDIVENQVTYPIVTALLGAPKVKPFEEFRITVSLTYM